MQSTESASAIECSVTINTRIKQLVEEKLHAIEMERKEFLNKLGRFTKQDIREICPSLSVSSVEGALRKMVNEGEIKHEGSG